MTAAVNDADSIDVHRKHLGNKNLFHTNSTPLSNFINTIVTGFILFTILIETISLLFYTNNDFPRRYSRLPQPGFHEFLLILLSLERHTHISSRNPILSERQSIARRLRKKRKRFKGCAMAVMRSLIKPTVFSSCINDGG